MAKMLEFVDIERNNHAKKAIKGSVLDGARSYAEIGSDVRVRRVVGWMPVIEMASANRRGASVDTSASDV